MCVCVCLCVCGCGCVCVCVCECVWKCFLQMATHWATHAIRIAPKMSAKFQWRGCSREAGAGSDRKL